MWRDCGLVISRNHGYIKGDFMKLIAYPVLPRTTITQPFQSKSPLLSMFIAAHCGVQNAVYYSVQCPSPYSLATGGEWRVDFESLAIPDEWAVPPNCEFGRALFHAQFTDEDGLSNYIIHIGGSPMGPNWAVTGLPTRSYPDRSGWGSTPASRPLPPTRVVMFSGCIQCGAWTTRPIHAPPSTPSPEPGGKPIRQYFGKPNGDNS